MLCPAKQGNDEIGDAALRTCVLSESLQLTLIFICYIPCLDQLISQNIYFWIILMTNIILSQQRMHSIFLPIFNLQNNFIISSYFFSFFEYRSISGAGFGNKSRATIFMAEK